MRLDPKWGVGVNGGTPPGRETDFLGCVIIVSEMRGNSVGGIYH